MKVDVSCRHGKRNDKCYTYHCDGEFFKVDVKCCLDSTTTRDDAAAFKSTLDGAQRVVNRTLHLIQAEVVRSTEDDGSCCVNLGSLHKDTLIIRYPLLDDFLCMTQVGCFELLISVKVGECAHKSGTGGLGYPSQVLLLASPHGHSTTLDKELENHVIDTLGGEDDIGSRLEDHLNPLQDDTRFSLTDLLQLIGVVHGNLNTKLHPLLLQVHIQTSDLRIGNPGCHSLGSNGTVEGVAVDENRFSHTLSMCLQQVDSLNRVFNFVPLVRRLHQKHSIHHHVCEEARIGPNDLAGHRRLGNAN